MPTLRSVLFASLFLIMVSCRSQAPAEDSGALTEETTIHSYPDSSKDCGPEDVMSDSTAGISLASPGITSCTLSVRDDLEPFIVTLLWVGPPETPEGFRMAHTLSVSPPGGGEPSVFRGLEAYYHSLSRREGYLVEEDMNFDGYRDMRLMRSPTAGPNTYWYFWLFDPGRGSFERALRWEDLGLVSPSFNPENGMITSFHRDGMGMYGTDYYEVREGIPVLVRSESTRYESEDSSVTTVMELVDGEMRVVQTSTYSVEQDP